MPSRPTVRTRRLCTQVLGALFVLLVALVAVPPAGAAPAAPRTDVDRLAEAAGAGEIERMRTYLDAGTDPNGLTSDEDFGVTPLMKAVSQNRLEAARLLLERGADAKRRAGPGLTALFLAASRSYVALVRLLVANGADPNARLDRSLGYVGGDTPLIAAIRSLSGSERREATVRLLLEAGADPNLALPGSQTPMQVVLSTPPDFRQVMLLLVSHGSDVNVKSRTGVTPLMLAASWGSVSVTQALLKAGARVDTRDPEGRTALMVASGWLYAGIIVPLRATPLPVECPAVIRVLLRAGADPALRDQAGRTALDWALRENRDENARTLREVGAATEVSNPPTAATGTAR